MILLCILCSGKCFDFVIVEIDFVLKCELSSFDFKFVICFLFILNFLKWLDCIKKVGFIDKVSKCKGFVFK